MHIRRKFEAAAQAGDARAAIAVVYFKKLYDVERSCKDLLQLDMGHIEREHTATVRAAPVPTSTGSHFEKSEGAASGRERQPS